MGLTFFHNLRPRSLSPTHHFLTTHAQSECPASVLAPRPANNGYRSTSRSTLRCCGTSRSRLCCLSQLDPRLGRRFNTPQEALYSIHRLSAEQSQYIAWTIAVVDIQCETTASCIRKAAVSVIQSRTSLAACSTEYIFGVRSQLS